MKNNTLFYFLTFICIHLYSNCESSNKNNKVYFTINTYDRQVVLPLQLDDSTTANLTFDSGAFYCRLVLDSTFCVSHPYLSFYNCDTMIQRQTGSAWTSFHVQGSFYEISQPVKIGNTNLTYNHIETYDYTGYRGNNYSDGSFNIPQDDTTHVWELNFEHNYLEIHDAETFKMPHNSILCPMVYPKGNICIQIPIHITCANGDTLTLNRIYVIDTGMPWDIVLMRTKELNFFNKKEDAVWTEYLSEYFRHYEVSAMLFDHYPVDSLRIYTFNQQNSVSVGYLIGINFLKRFNVFFDTKNHQIGLQPIKKFQRIIGPNYRRFHYSTYKTPDGKYIVKMVANYEKNYYKTAGLKVGDEIIAVNDTLYKDITYEQRQNFYAKDTLVFDIIRNRKAMKIIIPVDKTEEQGD